MHSNILGEVEKEGPAGGKKAEAKDVTVTPEDCGVTAKNKVFKYEQTSQHASESSGQNLA